jgi:hypothetical protein
MKKKIIAKVESVVLLINDIHLMVNIFIFLILHLFKLVQPSKACSSVITYLSK